MPDNLSVTLFSQKGSRMMTNKELIAYLQQYNDWRRGINDETMDEAGLKAAEIGEAIDLAILRLSHLDVLMEYKRCNK